MNQESAPSIAVCAIMKDEGHYLLEWLAFHLLMGATSIRIYDNDSTDGSSHVISLLSKRYPIEHVRWCTIEGKSPQLSAYNHAVKELAGKYSFVAFIDADEFLFPSAELTLPEALAKFDARASAIAVNQRVFGSSGHLNYTPDLVTSRFIMRAPVSYNENRFFKTVARPEFVQSISDSHSVNLSSGDYVFADGTLLARTKDHPGCAASVVLGQLNLHHYILKSREEFEKKRSRGGVMASTLKDRLKRYNEVGFFEFRDSKINAEVDNSLADFRSKILEKIAVLFEESRCAMSPGLLRAYDEILAMRNGDDIHPPKC